MAKTNRNDKKDEGSGDTRAPRTRLKIPELLVDRYEVVRRVGTGGMADVYLARDTELGRQVALKILHAQYASDPSFIERFRREAHAAANLQHPNIVQIYDWGREDDYHFIVMEFVEGQSLKDRIAADAPMEPEEAAEIAANVCSALGHAHRSGLVHRDIKPGNILLGSDGSVHVTDFGIARATEGDTMTQTGTILGTAYYLSPEQAQGLPLDARSDLYSLGVVLYEMVTGRRPFEGESPVSIAYKHVREQPRPPSNEQRSVSRALDAVILTALAKRPEDRYSSAALFRRDLEAFTEGREVTAAIPTSKEDSTQVLKAVGPMERAAAQRPGWLVALALALLAGGLALGTWSLISLFQVSLGTTEVPSIVSRTPVQAERLLRARGLEPSFQSDEPSNTIAEGLITRQDPPRDRRVTNGTTVRYWVSGGKPFVEVPELVGLDVQSAARVLTDAGLEVGERTDVFDPQPAGTVLDQEPRAGREVRSGTEVNVRVSKGQETAGAPNVIGMTEADAAATLANQGFRVARIHDFNDDFREGLVYDQDPDPGTQAETGSTVTIAVSRGPQQFAMPDVRGMTENEATEELEDRGLVVQSRERFTGNPAERDEVIDQDPPPGRTVSRGNTVTIYIGSDRTT